MDPLAAAITLLRPRTILSKIVSGSGRWGVRYAEYGDPSFCLMLGGSCWLTVEGGSGPLLLEAGDFLLMPATPGFTLSSEPDVEPVLRSPADAAADPVGEIRHGDQDGDAAVWMIGGYFQFDSTNASLLVDLLPVTLHIRHSDLGADRLHRIAGLLNEETCQDAPGRDLILERLVEILLIEAFRWRPADRDVGQVGLLAGLSDRHLGVALRQMHRDVTRDWTIEALARSAGVSRATFAERFTRTIGMPPMKYLLQWRMALAKDMLRNDRQPLERVAAAIGYQSASAFSTAFSRYVGVAPSAFARDGDVGITPNP
ncbi:MAG: AraC family transcriptional regulator [Gammaproteobacteria bacterium]